MNKILLLLMTLVMAACANQDKLSQARDTEPFLIYKTRADYSKNVPVLLNSDKTVIVSYPAPSDLKVNGEFQLPTQLKDGYLLDNRGIGLNVAFTAYSYAEYADLSQVPSLKKLMESIVDKDPLLEMYDCKKKASIKHDIDKLNRVIERNWKDCVRVK